MIPATASASTAIARHPKTVRLIDSAALRR
jgi:hypothetical protein